MGYSSLACPASSPLDRAAGTPLPARSVLHYELQRRLVEAAVAEINFPRFGPNHSRPDRRVRLPRLAWSRSFPDAAQDFDAFYRQRSPEPASGSILVAAVDCKGNPMVKPAGAQPASRLTKGQRGQQEAHGDCRHGRPLARPGCAPHNRLWKACSASRARPRRTRQRHRARKVTNHRLKAVALVTGCKPCSGRRPAKCLPAPSGLQEVDGLNHLL